MESCTLCKGSGTVADDVSCPLCPDTYEPSAVTVKNTFIQVDDGSSKVSQLDRSHTAPAQAEVRVAKSLPRDTVSPACTPDKPLDDMPLSPTFEYGATCDMCEKLAAHVEHGFGGGSTYYCRACFDSRALVVENDAYSETPWHRSDAIGTKHLSFGTTTDGGGDPLQTAWRRDDAVDTKLMSEGNDAYSETPWHRSDAIGTKHLSFGTTTDGGADPLQTAWRHDDAVGAKLVGFGAPTDGGGGPDGLPLQSFHPYEHAAWPPYPVPVPHPMMYAPPMYPMPIHPMGGYAAHWTMQPAATGGRKASNRGYSSQPHGSNQGATVQHSSDKQGREKDMSKQLRARAKANEPKGATTASGGDADEVGKVYDHTGNFVHEEDRTTVMIRKLPESFTRDRFVQMLDGAGYGQQYDFVYFPVDFAKASGLGYAFVNFVSNKAAVEAMTSFEQSEMALETAWSAPLQGREAHVQRYRDSPLMHHQVEDIFKPLLFKDGVRVDFPRPTNNKKLRPPRVKADKQKRPSQPGDENNIGKVNSHTGCE